MVKCKNEKKIKSANEEIRVQKFMTKRIIDKNVKCKKEKSQKGSIKNVKMQYGKNGKM